MKSTIFALTAITLASTTHAAAYDKYITLGAAHTETENTVRYVDKLEFATHSYTTELAFGSMLNESTAVEGNLTLPGIQQRKDRPEVEQIRINGFYFLSEDALKPYLTGGLGYGRVNVKDQSNPLISVGLGLEYNFTEKLFGRAEFRYDDMINEHAEFFNYGLELGFRFGEATATTYSKPAVEPSAEVEEEPYTPVEAIPVVALDSDNDGVTDGMDKCPDTSSSITVGEHGCPDFKGTLKGVNFRSGSNQLTASSRVILDKAATELKRYPDLNILIAAHSDSSGSDALNLKLSQQRAESVLKYLVSRGVSADKLTAKGYGETSPIASNETREGRAKNRRVELVVQ